ncbi:MAG: hypothetical protein JSR12_07715 [Bacteroidetes bacterium]|nr:hypothetical protein [Bacteroidota bacterium]
MRKIELRDIMRYYVSYYDIEKNIIDAILTKKSIKRETAYYRYVNNYMKIGRNFKPKSAAMVLGTVDNMLRNEGNLGVEVLSDRFVSGELVSRPEIKNVKVAASKLLWLFNKETIIMDNNNMQVLKVKSYKEYVIKWTDLFEQKIIEIDALIKLHFKNIDQILDERWFKMRVFDMYLLSVYAENLK